MRELKFRRSVYHGDGVFSHFQYWGFITPNFIIPEIVDNYDPDEQYIGIKDVDGNEIYEGDIVSIKGSTSSWGKRYNIKIEGVVKIGEFEESEKFGEIGCHIGVYIQADDRQISILDFSHLGIKVAGNIHQNQELIK